MNERELINKMKGIIRDIEEREGIEFTFKDTGEIFIECGNISVGMDYILDEMGTE